MRRLLTRLGAAVLAAALVGACAGDGDRAAPTTTAAPPTTVLTTTTTAPPATTTTAPPTTTTTEPPAPDTLRPGDTGPAVAFLQARLGELGYWLGEADGTYGHLTEQAVLAFQKVHGLSRDGIAGPATIAALETATRPTPRDPVDGIEIDLERQVLFVVQGGSLQWAFNTSTGTSGWRTPRGTFRIEREIDGMRHAPLGDLYRPKYFHGGIAVHGSTSIPAYPASHGCARVSNAAIDFLWSSGTASIGTEVRVY